MDLKYTDYDVADFTADPYFISSVLAPDEESESFWTNWVRENPSRQKAVHDARLLVLLMHSRRFRLGDQRREDLWGRIKSGALSKTVIKPAGRSVRWYKYAAVLAMVACCSYMAYRFYASDSLLVLRNEKGRKSAAYLPDGTKVWLNSESTLTYPKTFDHASQRTVFLEGEAFFDVVKNTEKPFIVSTPDLQVKVLGTMFNVRSYSNSGTTETTLVEGKVTIAVNGGESPVELVPDQQAVYSNQSRKLSVGNVKVDDVTSWKEGRLIIFNMPFYELMQELERWYDVKIVLKDEKSLACRFSTTIENGPITRILDMLKTTSGATYTILDKTITIEGSLCETPAIDPQ